MDKIGYIYKITNKINNKIYIGKTSTTIDKRYQHHIYSATHKNYKRSHLYEAMNKFGLNNFYVEEVEECDLDILDEREKYWIAYFNSTDNNIGYNITIGGTGGATWDQKGVSKPKRSEEAKRKTSESLKLAYQLGKHRVVKAGWKKGNKRTAEDVEKNKLRNRNKKWMYLGEKENPIEISCVFQESIQEHLQQGWKFGRPNFNSHTINKS